MPSAKAEKTAKDGYEVILNKFQVITKEPEQFICAQPEKIDDICALLQKTYKVSTSNDDTNARVTEMLQHLVVDDMDDEQIWQQLELRNNIVMNQFIEQTSKFLALREEKLEIRLKEDSDGDDDDEAVDEDVIDDEAEMNDEDGNDGGGDDDDEEVNDEDDRIFGLETTKKRKRKVPSSIVDDKFFKLREMEEFLEAEDAKEMRKHKGQLSKNDEDDGIDYFAEDLGDGIGFDDNDEAGDDDDDDDDDEEDADNNPTYKDFFDDDDVSETGEQDVKSNKEKNKMKKGKVRFADEAEENDEKDMDAKNDDVDDEDDDDEKMSEEAEEDDEEVDKNVNKFKHPLNASSSDDDADDGEEKPKSSFEMRQERLEQRIRDYEAEVLGEKPWQLKGEVQATNRPQNSLLEEILEFESTTRPAPVITEETTRCLEDIIRQRIKDQAWDDVVAKVRPIQTPHEYRKQLVLDQEKSKESLAQIYEKDYQRALDKLDPNRDDAAKEEEPKEHTQIRRLMRELFLKLDALSNFHFTPKPVAPEPKIITNTPAITMEEVAPVAVSDANLLAPEEVYRGPKAGLLGKSERNRTDKNRERRKKKQKQRAVHKALEAKDLHRQKMGIPLSKKEESAKLLKSITKNRNVDKITVGNDKSALKSSKSFFSKLQDTTNSANAPTKKKIDTKTISAKKLKL